MSAITMLDGGINYDSTEDTAARLRGVLSVRVWNRVHWFWVTKEGRTVVSFVSGSSMVDETNTIVFPPGMPLDAIVTRLCLEAP